MRIEAIPHRVAHDSPIINNRGLPPGNFDGVEKPGQSPDDGFGGGPTAALVNSPPPNTVSLGAPHPNAVAKDSRPLPAAPQPIVPPKSDAAARGPKALRGNDSVYVKIFQKPLIIHGVLVFEEEVETDALRTLLEQRLATLPRLQQRLLEGDGQQRPAWQADPNFSFDNHFHVLQLPPHSGHAALSTAIEDLMAHPLDPNHPPWSTTLVRGVGEGCALVLRANHALSDGMGLMVGLLGMADNRDSLELPGQKLPSLAAAPGAASAPGRAVSLPRSDRPLLATLHRSLDLAASVLQTAHACVFDPIKAASWLKPHVMRGIQSSRHLMATLSEMGTRGPDTITPLKSGHAVGASSVYWSQTPASLDDIKAVGNACGATVNDVILAMLTGAARRYMIAHSHSPTPSTKTRCSIAVSLQPLEERVDARGRARPGNHVAPITLELPVHLEHPQARLKAIRKRTAAMRGSFEPLIGSLMTRLVPYLSDERADQARRFSSERTSVILSNLPGPTSKLIIANHPVTDLKWFIPLYDDIALSLQVLSYNGQVGIAMSFDATQFSDPKQFDAWVADELNALAGTAASPSGGAMQGRRPKRAKWSTGRSQRTFSAEISSPETPLRF